MTAWLASRALAAGLGPLPDQALWLSHEVAFVVVALVLRSRVLPSRVPPGDAARLRALRALTGYVAGYYALWATCDVLILAGLDAAWLLRVLPNQLYYGIWVPFVWLSLWGRASGVAWSGSRR